MFLKVRNARHIKEHTLEIEFNNGIIKKVNLSNELNGNIFEPLKDLNYFRNFQIKYNTIEWDNGADFTPEFLFEIGQ